MQFLDSRGSSSSDSSSYDDINQDMNSQNLPDSGIMMTIFHSKFFRILDLH